ncbi:MAG: flavin monoamine oxidase family protein [Caulobacteraceae bacterium]
MNDHYDIAIVGAGAAGLAAARRLRGEPLEVVLLEARDRVGGRAWTIAPRPGMALDAGCEWLHSATRNVFAPLIEAKGLTLDRTPAHWVRRTSRVGLGAEDSRAFGEAYARLDVRLEEAAARGVDAPASDFLEPGGRWNGLLNAVSSWYNGAEWDGVSVLDYAAYEDTGGNWRVRQGYGAAIASVAGPVDPMLDCSVEAIDHGRAPIGLTTAKGTLTARAAIVSIPTNLLARGAIRFTPPLPAKVEAAAGVPLGLADKAFLAVRNPELLSVEGHAFGRADRAATASYFLRPVGLPYVEAYFGGHLAADLEREGPGALTAFAIDELGALLGSEVRRALTPLAETAWTADPFARGAYSHALPGHAGDRAVLAAPVDGRLFFAGEATHPSFFSTAHGAWETGVRAAEEALAAVC